MKKVLLGVGVILVILLLSKPSNDKLRIYTSTYLEYELKINDGSCFSESEKYADRVVDSVTKSSLRYEDYYLFNLGILGKNPGVVSIGILGSYYNIEDVYVK